MFKDKLKENRVKLDLSQEELAQKVFVSRSAIAKWEQGRGLPGDESLDRLAGLFGTTADLLLTKQDMKEEVAQSEKNSLKSRKKAIISFVVAGLAVGALAITLLTGTFAYNPTGNEESEILDLNDVIHNEERVVTLDFEGQGKADYSKWQKAVFKDEAGFSVPSIQDLNLRKGDKVEISYLADANMFGRKRIGSTGLSEISLKSHEFDSTQTLFGVGYSF